VYDTHYIDAEIRPVLDQLAAAYGDYARMTVAEIRSRFAQVAAAMSRPLPANCSDGYVDVPGPAGVISCRYFKPANAGTDLPVILHFLGGTFVTTSLDQVGWNPIKLAMEVGCVVVTPLHRMPPEHPFPAAYDDCFAVYRWFVENARRIGGDPGRIALVGESSGGTLAASVCIDAREAGLPQPALQVLAEPLLDHESETPSMNEFTHVISKEILRPRVSYYFGETRPPRRASPLLAESLAGLAPAYVITAGLDPLRDEAIAFVARLRREGVFVAHRHHEGQIHGFFSMYDQITQARVAFAECCAVIRLALTDGISRK
jgi:acetyl esterase